MAEALSTIVSRCECRAEASTRVTCSADDCACEQSPHTVVASLMLYLHQLASSWHGRRPIGLHKRMQSWHQKRIRAILGRKSCRELALYDRLLDEST